MKENFKLHDVTRILLGRLITRTVFKREIAHPRSPPFTVCIPGCWEKSLMCLLILGQKLIIGPAQRAISVQVLASDDPGHERRTKC